MNDDDVDRLISSSIASARRAFFVSFGHRRDRVRIEASKYTEMPAAGGGKGAGAVDDDVILL